MRPGTWARACVPPGGATAAFVIPAPLVIPAQAGIQCRHAVAAQDWTAACAGGVTVLAFSPTGSES